MDILIGDYDMKKTIAGILLIILGLLIFTVMRAALGHGSWLGTLIMAVCIGGGVFLLKRKSK